MRRSMGLAKGKDLEAPISSGSVRLSLSLETEGEFLTPKPSIRHHRHQILLLVFKEVVENFLLSCGLSGENISISSALVRAGRGGEGRGEICLLVCVLFVSI